MNKKKLPAKPAATDQAADPTALTAPQLAELLTKAGATKIKLEDIEADVAAGAPTNGDGTIHLVHYTAWLIANTR